MSMTIRHAIFGATIAAASIFACSQGTSQNAVGQAQTTEDDGGDGATTADASDAGVCKSPPQLAVCSDGQAAAIYLASSKGSIDVATAVVGRLTDASAFAFAQRVIQDGTAANTAFTALLASVNVTPVDNGLSAQITEGARGEIQALSTKTGADLDRAYIDHEILGHLAALGVGDHLLAPGLQDAQLAAAAADARVVVAARVQVALDVQKTLEGACGSGATDAGTDAGTTDGGTTADGGTTSDGGEGTDAGSSTDAGTSTDSGTSTDAGTSTDSGTSTDAGTGSTTL